MIIYNIYLTGGTHTDHGGCGGGCSGGFPGPQRELEHELAGDLQPIWGLLPASQRRRDRLFCCSVAVPSPHLVLCSVPQKPLIKIGSWSFARFSTNWVNLVWFCSCGVESSDLLLCLWNWALGIVVVTLLFSHFSKIFIYCCLLVSCVKMASKNWKSCALCMCVYFRDCHCFCCKNLGWSSLHHLNCNCGSNFNI